MDRAEFEQQIQRALAQVAASSAYGTLTLKTLNRARREILAAADAYRRWVPEPAARGPLELTATEQIMAAERRAQVQLARHWTRNERPSA